MHDNYSDNPDLLEYLENMMMDLRTHYHNYYARDKDTTMQCASIEQTHMSSSALNLFPSKVNFTLRYKREEPIDRDELVEYFKLQWEDWDAVNPLQWWVE